MKNVRILLMIAFVGVFGFSSCSKKADDVTPASAQVVGFQAKVDGKSYTPDFAYALASFPGGNGYYAIYGLDSKTNDVVAIALPTTAAEGTYPLNNVNLGIITFNKEDFTTINGGSGTVTITKKTATNMAGTFSFTAYDATGAKKIALTEGAFNVNVR